MIHKVENFQLKDGIPHKQSGTWHSINFTMSDLLNYIYRTILLSVISLLNEPNTSSAANVDASVMYRKWVEKKDDRYVKFIRY